MARSSTAFFNLQFALLCFSNFLFSCSFSMMIPELPGYLTQLGGEQYKGLIIALFTLMAGISRPFSGKLTDTVGRVPVMIFGSLVCVACSLLYPVLTTVSGFLLLRFFHGFSTGFKPTATSAYGADVVHESRRGEAMGILALGYSLGSSVGPVLGSWLVSDFSYSVMFYVSSGCALGSVAILYNIRETLPHPQKFAFRHLKVKKEELFEKSAVRPAVIMLLLCFSIGCMLTLSPDLSASVGIANKGLFYAVYTVASLLIRLVAGKSSDKYGRVIVLVLTAVVQGIAFIMLCFAHSATAVMASAVVYGIGVGMTGPTLMAWAVDLCQPQHRGRAVASVYIALEMGIGCGALVCASIYNNRLSNLPYAFLLTAALAFIAMLLLISWMRKEKRKVPAMEEVVEIVE